jgi:pimeloyl-ACP methyl ester carboxylesterase
MRQITAISTNPAEWKKRGKFYNYKSRSIFYMDEGEGEALVCIHGFPTSSWDWSLIWPGLIERFRVIAPDMIGYGFSDKPIDYSYSILDQATLHEDLLQSLGIDQIHILAHDYGDTVAQELLARYEDRKREKKTGIVIKTVCFLNGGLFPETHRPRLIQKLLMSPFGSIFSKLVSEERFRRSFTAIFGKKRELTESELKDYWSIVSYNNGLSISYKLIHYMSERKKYRSRWVGVLQNTEVPMRLINGPLDPVSGAHMAQRYRELVPNSDVILLKDTGHYPQVEDPQGVLEAFSEFLKEEQKKHNNNKI